MTTKNILTIAPYAFGYTKHIHDALERYHSVKSHIIYLDEPKFRYKNIWHKVQNFISKIFGKNLKKHFVYDRIKSAVTDLVEQDVIFIIRPDLLDDGTLKYLKSRTRQFIAYYYDSTRRFPRKVAIKHFFNKIYSYDTLDVKQYGFTLLTNYIYDESENKNHKNLFFNISTYDYRFPIIEQVAKYLKTHNWTYDIQVYNRNEMESDVVDTITQQKSILEVAELIKQSKIIIEIQRTEQVGLSFRVFEALGHRKKLITTNKAIINYDFYNPNNILVIDENAVEIPEDFVTSDYKTVEEHILNKYRIKNWVKPIFNLS